MNNNKNIKLFRQYLIDITLKNCCFISKIALSDLKSCFLFITFIDFYLIVSTS